MNNFSNSLPPQKNPLSNTQNFSVTTSDSGIRMVLQKVLLLSYPSIQEPQTEIAETVTR